MIKDPYTVLGVSRIATADEVKRAFHRLAHQHHPDKGGNAEKFKECSAAYAEINRYIASGYHAGPTAPRQEAPFKDNPAWADLRRRAGATASAHVDQKLNDLYMEMIRQQQRQQNWKVFYSADWGA